MGTRTRRRPPAFVRCDISDAIFVRASLIMSTWARLADDVPTVTFAGLPRAERYIGVDDARWWIRRELRMYRLPRSEKLRYRRILAKLEAAKSVPAGEELR